MSSDTQVELDATGSAVEYVSHSDNDGVVTVTMRFHSRGNVDLARKGLAHVAATWRVGLLKARGPKPDAWADAVSELVRPAQGQRLDVGEFIGEVQEAGFDVPAAETDDFRAANKALRAAGYKPRRTNRGYAVPDAMAIHSIHSFT